MEKLNDVCQLKYVVSKTVEKGYNNMNINPSNAENISAVATNQDRPEHRDPIEELNPISLLKKPDQFKQAFFSMACLSTQSFKAKNYQQATLALTKCTDMLDLGRTILKDINRHWKLVIFANLACCYHYTRKLSKCNKFCQRIKQQLQKIISESPEKETFLKLTRILIKLKFQHCAILSQLQQHNRAFQLCKSTIPMLKEYIETLLNYVEEHSSIETAEKRSSQTVQFSRQVHKFAQTLLTDLLRCINQPLKKQERTNFYYWQKNPEQNQQQVKKKFIPHSDNTSCKRSILGVSKSTHWIDEFNIGTIMHFSEMSINDFDGTIPIEEYLFKDRLYELVIYCSMANFTMATELRLIQSTQQEKQENLPSSSHNQLLKKYGYEQKSQLFKLSQIYHLRSIEIMARNIKSTVPYITHIIRSYEKHYIKHKKILEPIAAIVQESALSLNSSISVRANKEEQTDGYYETTYSNYMKKQEQNQYRESQPMGDLLLESQRNAGPLAAKKSEKNIEIIKEQEEDKKQLKEPQLNSLVQAPKQQAKMLLTVKSEGGLPRVDLDSLKDDVNTSGQYLKSHRKETSKVKKGLRQKSHSKATLRSKPTVHNSTKDNHRDYKDPKKAIKPQRKQQSNHNEYRLKTETSRPDTKKEKERKTLKKQKTEDHDKYGQKQIKIKTESCTHIKVTYKKKK